MTAYLALIRKDRGSDYGVEFPDFPGCVTAGRTLEDARILASEALAFHVKGMLEDGLPIPSPSPLDRVSTSGAVVLTVELPESKVVRVNLTVPSTDLAIIDSYLKGRRGESRSALMVKGALRLIDRDRSPAAVRPMGVKVKTSRLATKKSTAPESSSSARRSPAASRIRK